MDHHRKVRLDDPDLVQQAWLDPAGVRILEDKDNSKGDSGFTTAVEHTNAEQNSWGRGFENLVGAGLFSSPLFHLTSASLIQVPHSGATLLIFLLKNKRQAGQLEAKQA